MNRQEFIPVSEKVDQLARTIIDSAFQVHRELGPGLLESVYQSCLCYELSSRKIKFEQEIVLPIKYKKLLLESGLRLDLLIEKSIIVELKSVEKILPIHEAQILTYLKITGCRLGLIINFNEVRIKSGIKRLVL
ncbi:MAG: GxxExxY protein [Planctomycetaceae bacterium]|nr:GxxExxY protein [Planctomycetaceae bacterium]